MPERVPPHKVDRPCPMCGSRCFSDSRNVWCTRNEQVGVKSVRLCSYGLKSFVTVEQHREGS